MDVLENMFMGYRQATLKPLKLMSEHYVKVGEKQTKASAIEALLPTYLNHMGSGPNFLRRNSESILSFWSGPSWPKPEKKMKSTSRPIFRPEAVRRYTESRERSVLPPLVSTPVMDFLWYLVALLVFGGVAVWTINIPVYTSGLAIAVDNQHRLANSEEDAALLVLLPAEAQPALGEGKTVLVQVNTSGKPLRQKIVAFESDPLQVSDILSRFGLSNHPAVVSAQPAAVAFTDLGPMPGQASVTDYTGSVFRADMQVGSRRAASVLPLID